MIHLVTFASDDMSKSADRCVGTFWIQSNAPHSYQRWSVVDLEGAGFFEDREEWKASRGVGFWAWKPFIIEKRLTDTAIEDGDILIYADAGVEFIEPVQTVIDLMDQDIWLFGNEHQHAHWCKADIIEEILPMAISPRGWRNADYGFGKQVQASVIFFRVNDHTRAFVKEWLDWCLFEGGRLIDDSPSRLPNHPEFKENRHDQAILTTMAYRDGIKLHEWYVKYEGYTPGRMNGYPRELERPFVFHHRRRNADWDGIAA